MFDPPLWRLASGFHPFEPFGGERGYVGLGIAGEKVGDGLAELLGSVLGHVGKGMEKHEFGHDGGERILFLHGPVSLVDGTVAVGEIVFVGLLIEGLLTALHSPQVVEIGGVAHGGCIFRFGEPANDQFPVDVGLGGTSAPHVHEIFVVIHIEPVDILGIAFHEFVPLGFGGVEVLELVLEYET